MNTTTKRQSGFSVIELLVAIVLFAILVPTIVGFLNSIGALNQRAKDISIVNSVAENKVESLRSAGYSAISTGIVDFTDELPNSIAEPRSAEYEATIATAGVMEIIITIEYRSGGGAKTSSYTTYIGELGV